MKYGLLGERLPHSFSKTIHSYLGSYEYEPRELSKEEFADFMAAKDFCAVNVTIPYKQAVIPYLDEISEEAEAIGAVNTVVNRGGRLCGYNTDYLGLKSLILKHIASFEGMTVLILGTGGTSLTAEKAALDLGAEEVIRVSRSEKDGVINYERAYSEKSFADVIINTTPLGMYPDISSVAADVKKFPKLKLVIDVVYNPLRTELVQQAREAGTEAQGGLYMLVAQAVYASEYFTGKKYPPETIERVYKSVIGEKENIVLSGMPGCGKSTVAALLAKKTGKKAYDTDEIIVRESGMEISDIFEKYGEEYFRRLESETVKRLSLRADNLIISLGGGAVLKPDNVRALKKNGRIYFIDRPLEELMPTSDRPLAQSRAALAERFRERYRTYEGTADKIIKVIGDANVVAEMIRKDYCDEGKD